MQSNDQCHDGCDVERPDGARWWLSRGSGKLRAYVAVSRHVYHHISMFRATSDHSHSAAISPDIHCARHQEGRPNSWLAGLHLVNLSADWWYDRRQVSATCQCQHGAVSSSELCISSTDYDLTDAGASSGDASCCRAAGQCVTVRLGWQRSSRRPADIVSSCSCRRHQQLGTWRPASQRRTVEPFQCHQHVSTTWPTLTSRSVSTDVR